MGLEQVVDVQISSQSSQVTQAGFGTMLILGTHTNFAERLRYYTDADTLLDDGFLTTDPEYLAAVKAFSQELKPERIAVGRRVALEAVEVALAAVEDEQPDWYALVITSRTEVDILAAAAWIEAKRKIFIACSDDADVLAAPLTDIASLLNAASYARTAYFWSGDQAGMPEAGILGRMLPEIPGSATFKFKTIAGVTFDAFTATERANAIAKKANIYERLAGVSIFAEGTMAVGEFIDIIIGIDWLQARLQERIYAKLVALPKIPYTDAGTAVVEAEIRAQLREGILNQFLASTPEPVVTVPLVADVNPLDRAARFLPGITFQAQVAGAIHKLQIRGVVTV